MGLGECVLVNYFCDYGFLLFTKYHMFNYHFMFNSAESMHNLVGRRFSVHKTHYFVTPKVLLTIVPILLCQRMNCCHGVSLSSMALQETHSLKDQNLEKRRKYMQESGDSHSSK